MDCQDSHKLVRIILWANAAGFSRRLRFANTEERLPFFIEHYEFRSDSGGDGTWRGGLGATFLVVYEGRETALLDTGGDGMVNLPYGLQGANRASRTSTASSPMARSECSVLRNWACVSNRETASSAFPPEVAVLAMSRAVPRPSALWTSKTATAVAPCGIYMIRHLRGC